MPIRTIEETPIAAPDGPMPIDSTREEILAETDRRFGLLMSGSTKEQRSALVSVVADAVVRHNEKKKNTEG